MTHGDNRNATGDADAGHGADNKGNESMKEEDPSAADIQKISDAELSGMVTNGKSKMEPDKTMNPGQVKIYRRVRLLARAVNLWGRILERGASTFALRAKEETKEEVMKKVLSVIAVTAMFYLVAPVSRAQDSAKGEKTFKAKCAGCHGADGAGKPAMKSPPIKGKSAEEISKAFSTSPKHASLKSLSPAAVKDLAAYLATLK